MQVDIDHDTDNDDDTRGIDRKSYLSSHDRRDKTDPSTVANTFTFPSTLPRPKLSSTSRIIIGYTTMTCDLMHEGHINLLKNAKTMCDQLIVGLTTDELAIRQKRQTYFNFTHRKTLLEACRYVDVVVENRGYSKEVDYQKLKFDRLFIGDDYYDRDEYKDFEVKYPCVPVIYLPRTSHVATSELIADFQNRLVQTLTVHNDNDRQGHMNIQINTNNPVVMKTWQLSLNQYIDIKPWHDIQSLMQFLHSNNPMNQIFIQLVQLNQLFMFHEVPFYIPFHVSNFSVNDLNPRLLKLSCLTYHSELKYTLVDVLNNWQHSELYSKLELESRFRELFQRIRFYIDTINQDYKLSHNTLHTSHVRFRSLDTLDVFENPPYITNWRYYSKQYDDNESQSQHNSIDWNTLIHDLEDKCKWVIQFI